MTTPKHLRADGTPPRTGMIAMYAALAALCLIGLKPIFDSYFESMFSAEISAKVSTQPAVEYDAIRRREDALLLQTGVPMERVFAQLARGRQAGPTLIAPQASTDLAAIQGWNGLPAFVHTANAEAVAAAAAASAAAAAAEAAAVAAAAAAAAAAALPPADPTLVPAPGAPIVAPVAPSAVP